MYPEDVLTMTDWAVIAIDVVVGFPLLLAFARWVEKVEKVERRRPKPPPVNRKIRLD